MVTLITNETNKICTESCTNIWHGSMCIYIYGGSLGTCVHEYGFRRNDDVLPLKAGRLKLNGPSRIYENTIFSDSGSTT